MNVCTACALAGLAVCAHLTVLSFVEAAHPQQTPARPAITIDVLPVEPDHAHRDYHRAVQIVDTDVTVGGAPSDALPPGDDNYFTLAEAARIARRNFARQWRVPSMFLFTSPDDEIPRDLAQDATPNAGSNH